VIPEVGMVVQNRLKNRVDIRWKPSKIPRVFGGSRDFLQVCNTLIHRFKSGLRLLEKPGNLNVYG
jgi:hypothetical protein